MQSLSSSFSLARSKHSLKKLNSDTSGRNCWIYGGKNGISNSPIPLIRYVFGWPHLRTSAYRAGFTITRFKGVSMFKSSLSPSLFLCGAYFRSCRPRQSLTTLTRSRNAIASPEARAEAKRLYKEGVKYGLAGLVSASCRNPAARREARSTVRRCPFRTGSRVLRPEAVEKCDREFEASR